MEKYLTTLSSLTNLTRIFRDKLYSNSIYLITSSIINSGIGLIFWVIAAKMYSSNEIGIASALISSMSLIVLVSRIGLDNSLVRSLPKGNRNNIITTTIIITTTLSILIGIVYIFNIDLLSPNLHELNKHPLYFMLFLIVNSIYVMIDTSIISLRLVKYKIWLGFLGGARMLLLIPFVFLGAYGIFVASGISVLLSLSLAIYILNKNNIRMGIFDKHYINSSIKYSLLSYVSNIFVAAPALILPILIINSLGNESAAHYFMAYSYASILFLIPAAASVSLFVEGSHGENLEKNMKKSLKFSMVVLVPLIIGTYSFGGWFLSMIGTEYQIQGFELLKLFAIASLFVTIFQIQFSFHLVKTNLRFLTYSCTILCFLLIILSQFFIMIIGISGVGYAWIISYATVCLLFYLNKHLVR